MRFALVALIVVLATVSQARADDSVLNICAPNNSTVYFDNISGVASPCATAPGTFVAQATYLQNASNVGGTTMAAYPMLALRTGVVRDLAFVVNAPSEVAETGQRGLDLYTPTRLGYGLRYTASETNRFALAFTGEVLPAISRFSPNQTQPKYALGFTSDYALSPRFMIGFSSAGTSSGSVGFQRVLPSGAFTASYNASAFTAITTDLGTHITARHSTAQSFGDLAIDQTVSKHLVLKLGLGTTFNPVGDTKAHYLASGVNYRM